MTTRNQSTLVGTDAPQEKKLAGLGLVGAVISGFLASACCIGPLLMVLLGVGSAGALTALEPWRPVMMVLTFLFLGLGFYATYRRPQTANCSETACCGPGRKRLQKLMLWLAALFSLAMLFFPQIMQLMLD
ncbi:mercuric transporter MerT family protein [Geothermobacter hydrogeniphilus]|uniref:Mercuric transport protein MerT n=1 Tax=Geothermobacter hydrogeniphilus TaxID=1969733 RepID=A0A1X0Y617_9BACT|nr:mercuric transporter MerT family protein [Geothermobacter hydrogeniphilus]ORJ60583.1 hypothetical protein B5V00_07030 [Geothermobacter hydrogeniphilus]